VNVYVIPTKKQTRLGRGGAYGPVPRLCRSVRSIYRVFFRSVRDQRRRETIDDLQRERFRSRVPSVGS